MSIPLTASTETFTPECMAEIEGAPSFTFRHATEMDKYEFGINITAEGLKTYSLQDRRDKIMSELRRLFEGEGLEQNITRLQAYWQADDELAAALREHQQQVLEIRLAAAESGEEPELPPEPVLEFPAEDLPGIDLMLAQVNEHSEILSLMAAQNMRYQLMYPRMLLRMFLKTTTLPVTIQRRGELITPACCEAVLSALDKEAKRLGVDPDLAQSQLMTKAMLSFALTEDEEKNSSSPRSGSTPPKQSANKQSTGPQTTPSTSLTDPVTGEPVNGSISPA